MGSPDAKITSDNLNEMDCVMIQTMLQTGANKDIGKTVDFVTKVVEGRLKDMQTIPQEERKQQVGSRNIGKEQEGEGSTGSDLSTEEVQVNDIPGGARFSVGNTPAGRRSNIKSPVKETTRRDEKGTTQLHWTSSVQCTATILVYA